MIDMLLSHELRPFVFGAGLIIGFLLVELVLMALGMSSDILSDGGAEFDTDFDFDAGAGIDLDADLETAVETSQGGASSGMMADILLTTGLSRLPLTVWLALYFAFFSSVGFMAQALLDAFTGTMLRPAFICLPATALGILLTGRFARAIERFIPRDETTAISIESLGRRRGTVTVGTSRRGYPANVRITDQHGNTHYLMLEPLEDEAEIPEGTDVYVLRTRDDGLRITAA